MKCSKMEEFAAHSPGADKWAVFPQMLNPLMWDGILQTTNQLVKVPVHVTEGVGKEVARVDRGGASTEILKQAAQAESADVLLRFARFPGVRIEGMQFGYRVTFFDFRFYDETDKTTLGAEIIMDQSMHVTKQSLSFAQTLR
jgi:hypothetical protein